MIGKEISTFLTQPTPPSKNSTRFELHSETQPPYDVLLGLLGSQLKQPASPFELVWEIGRSQTRLEYPRDIAVDDRPGVPLTIYLSDSATHRIVKYDDTGKLVNWWGGVGSGVAEFRMPTDLALTPDGNLYVLDSGNQRIQKFDPTGKFLLQFGSPGSRDGQFGGCYLKMATRFTGHTVD